MNQFFHRFFNSFLPDILRSFDHLLTILLFYFDKQAMNRYLARWKIAKVGSNTWIAPNVIFDLFKNDSIRRSHTTLIEIGSGCIITEYTQFITHDTSLNFFRKLHHQPESKKWASIKIGDSVFIGARCIILPGVEIGRGSLIGAGSVVTKSVKPGYVYAGNPAKPIMSVGEYIGKANLHENSSNRLPTPDQKLPTVFLDSRKS